MASSQEVKVQKRMLEYAKLARDSTHSSTDPNQSYKEQYAEDMAQKVWSFLDAKCYSRDCFKGQASP